MTPDDTEASLLIIIDYMERLNILLQIAKHTVSEELIKIERKHSDSGYKLRK